MQRKYAQAETLFREALQKRAVVLGPGHYLTLDCKLSLANLYRRQRKFDLAVPLLEELVAEAKASQGEEDVLTLSAMNDLAWTHLGAGKHELAVALFDQVLAKSKEKGDAQDIPTRSAMQGLARVYLAAKTPEKAVALFEQTLARCKENFGSDAPRTLAAMDGLGLVYLQVAAQQAWLGQDKELNATCQRALSLAQDTKNLTLAERVVKLCSLRPADDKMRQDALILARRAVQLGKGHRSLPYFQTALGMAEYRSGHFAEADTTLSAAMEAGKNNRHIAGMSAFYRAMSLFQLGKQEEARQLATQATAKMMPLPKDDKDPVAAGAFHDDLILWLAYKEAKALIQFDTAPVPEGKPDQ